MIDDEDHQDLSENNNTVKPLFVRISTAYTALFTHEDLDETQVCVWSLRLETASSGNELLGILAVFSPYGLIRAVGCRGNLLFGAWYI